MRRGGTPFTAEGEAVAAAPSAAEAAVPSSSAVNGSTHVPVGAIAPSGVLAGGRRARSPRERGGGRCMSKGGGNSKGCRWERRKVVVDGLLFYLLTSNGHFN